MNQWEYFVFRGCRQEQLNEFGKWGWELIAVVPQNPTLDRAKTEYIFKREKDEQVLMADDTPVKDQGELCGATKAAGWAARQVCSFSKHGPEKPHSWVVDL